MGERINRSYGDLNEEGEEKEKMETDSEILVLSNIVRRWRKQTNKRGLLFEDVGAHSLRTVLGLVGMNSLESRVSKTQQETEF